MAAGRRDLSGGIFGLVSVIEEHESAIEYDLLTKTRYSLADVGESLSYKRLLAFIKHLPSDSALFREMEPDTAPWMTGEKTAALLADMYDLIESFKATFVNSKSKRKLRSLTPYPRPWLENKGVKKVGKDPIPISEFESWWEGGK